MFPGALTSAKLAIIRLFSLASTTSPALKLGIKSNLDLYCHIATE